VSRRNEPVGFDFDANTGRTISRVPPSKLISRRNVRVAALLAPTADSRETLQARDLVVDDLAVKRVVQRVV
jgi:hypothetical protein